MPADGDSDGGDDKVVRSEVLALICRETTDLRKSVDEAQERVETVERRLNLNYVNSVNVCSKIIPPKTDWLAGIRKMFVDMEVLPSDDIERHVVSLDLVTSRPKNNVYVIQVSDSLKKVVTSPCPGTRKRIDDYCTKKGKGKGDVVRFFPRLTREEESSRNKSRFYVDLLIRHQESINQKEFLVKVPGNGRLDRVIRESRNRDANFKREYLSYEQVAEIVGSKTDLIDKQYDAQCSKKKEIASRKRTINDVDGNSSKRRLPAN
ncbi:hypothetical protein PRIPAC_83638 [Pristionchus pacificus]|uniref:Uncharacterized protein n=1 Tax=Pristionchus pacificus TaxID=54126 RepID=A0A2A6BL04_PRIPA|nr:hypothetical protein PRIPAC_83638 [Pristionchus pacificus]|eukprot:PDM66528.1 hypothetical protein PRIPAC_47945 [Pristionchus pacificus]